MTIPSTTAIRPIVATFASIGAATALVAAAGIDRLQTIVSGIAIQLLWAAVGWRFLSRSTLDFMARRFRRR